jgi:hypothetical protein
VSCELKEEYWAGSLERVKAELEGRPLPTPTIEDVRRERRERLLAYLEQWTGI